MELASAQSNLRPGQSVGMAKHGDDSGLYVLFHFESVEIPIRSEQEGRPIFEDRPYVTIIFPGDNTRKTVRPVRMKGDGNTPSDPERWPRQWAAFQSQSVQPDTGTPVTEWAAITKSQAMMLKASQIHTVDQLAVVPDHALTWMGAREMQVKAQAFLTQRDHGKDQIERLQAELAQSREAEAQAKAQRDEQAAQIAQLQEQMATLIAQAAQEPALAPAPEVRTKRPYNRKPKADIGEGTQS